MINIPRFFAIFAIFAIFPVLSKADGIIIIGTRAVYNQSNKQENVYIRNTSDTNNFLVQSWVDDSSGKKTKDFIITPPLYISKPQNENILRLIYAGPELPADRETLFHLNVKAIPSLDKEQISPNKLTIAVNTRIKLFYRPKGLIQNFDDILTKVIVSKKQDQLEISNNSGLFLNMINLSYCGKELRGIMVPPKNAITIAATDDCSGSFKYHLIDDFGGISKEKTNEIQ